MQSTTEGPRLSYEPGPLKFSFKAYNDHIWVSGFGESGKTKLVQFLLLPLFKGYGHLVAIYDYNHNYDYDHKNRPIAGLPVVHDWRALAQSLIKRQSIIYQAPVNSRENFEKFCRVCAQVKGLIVVLEEFQEFVHKNSMPDYVSAIIHTGRNAYRSYVVITQRPQEVPTVALSNAKHRFYFKQDYDSPTELKWLRGAIGEKAIQLERAEPYSYVYKLRSAHAVLKKKIQLPPGYD